MINNCQLDTNKVNHMRVKKRTGNYQPVDFSKISNRIKYLVEGYDPEGTYIGEKLIIDPNEIAKDVCALIIDGISTTQLDEFAAELCAYRVGDHYHYDTLASRIIISNHHKNTDKYKNFSDMMEALYQNKDNHGKSSPLISDTFYKSVMASKSLLDDAVNKNHIRDYECLDYFGFKTLEKSYLLKIKTVSPPIQERYQHLLMREAFNLYQDDIETAIKCYEWLSQALFTHATPTLFNSGTPNQQLSSCFVAGMDDSIDGMYECIRRLAHVSKGAGGIGLHLHKIRSRDSLIRGTNGESSGPIPLIKVINDFAKHVDQGGKRKGSVAIYLEPWHADIFDFLELKKNSGVEELRARDLFYGLWIPNLFMKRIKAALTLKRVTGTHDIKWSLMCPDECPGLADCWGEEFEQMYIEYEKQGRYKKQINILILWQAILDSQKETGTPYMCYKDHVNNKSNQKNVGIIRSSNLCVEIMEYSDHEEYAVCNLASVNLKKMVKFQIDENTGCKKPYFDFKLLHDVVKMMAQNLNRIIDINHYPLPQTKKSNFRHRPIGIGVQALAGSFILMGFPFESNEAKTLNKDIFETIYHAAVETSCELAEKRYHSLSKVPIEILSELKDTSSYLDYYENHFKTYELQNRQNLTKAETKILQDYRKQHEILMNRASEIIECYDLPKQIAEYQFMNLDQLQYMGAYSTFVGSPAHAGQLQYDLWGVQPSGRWDFDEVKSKMRQYGLRNSLLLAQMPTATTAEILGSECGIEPITSIICARQVLSGTFFKVNKHLQIILTQMGLWSREMKDKILLNNGSVQDIEEIPIHLRQLFKTAWEMSKKTLIDMAADIAAWICQSLSLNQFITDPDDHILSSVHLHGWEKGLKTGMYYLRRRTLVDPQKFSIDIGKHQSQLQKEILQVKHVPEMNYCSRNEPVDPQKFSNDIGKHQSQLQKEILEVKPVPEMNYCSRNEEGCTSCGT